MFSNLATTAQTNHMYKSSCINQINSHNTSDKPRTSRSKFKQFQTLPVPCHYIRSLMKFNINTREFFKQIHVCTILIQGISIIFIHQMPIYLVFKKSTFYAGIQILNRIPPSVTILKNDRAKFKAAIRIYLHTHSFYSVDKVFV